METAQQIISFWFGAINSPNYGNPQAFWFQSTPEIDQNIKDLFGATYEAAAKGELVELAQTAEGSLALVLVLDQFPRNMFRGTPQAFATDHMAAEIAKMAIAKGFDTELMLIQSKFLYMPFMHSENLEDQDRCVQLFENLGEEAGLDYAKRHRDIIARFGRFPHRNSILNRQNSPEELEFLQQPKSSF